MKHSKRNVYPDPNGKGWCWKLGKMGGRLKTREEACSVYISCLISQDSTARELLSGKPFEQQMRMLELD